MEELHSEFEERKEERLPTRPDKIVLRKIRENPQLWEGMIQGTTINATSEAFGIKIRSGRFWPWVEISMHRDEYSNFVFASGFLTGIRIRRALARAIKAQVAKVFSNILEGRRFCPQCGHVLSQRNGRDFCNECGQAGGGKGPPRISSDVFRNQNIDNGPNFFSR